MCVLHLCTKAHSLTPHSSSRPAFDTTVGGGRRGFTGCQFILASMYVRELKREASTSIKQSITKKKTKANASEQIYKRFQCN